MKKCARCEEFKAESEFSWKVWKKQLAPECKTCHRQWRIEYYKANKEIEKRAVKRRIKALRNWMTQIRSLIGQGKNNCQIGREFGVCHSTISAIRRGKTWI